MLNQIMCTFISMPLHYAELFTCTISFDPYRATLLWNLGLQSVLLTPSLGLLPLPHCCQNRINLFPKTPSVACLAFWQTHLESLFLKIVLQYPGSSTCSRGERKQIKTYGSVPLRNTFATLLPLCIDISSAQQYIKGSRSLAIKSLTIHQHFSNLFPLEVSFPALSLVLENTLLLKQSKTKNIKEQKVHM